MAIHATTGNRLDVVYEYQGDRKVILGLWWHEGSVLIPLPEPDGLLISLRSILNQQGERRTCQQEKSPNENA